MPDAPAPAPDADPLQSPDAPGVRDDTAPGDPLLAGMEAVRNAKPTPGAGDIAADDAGATAMAERLGDTIRKG